MSSTNMQKHQMNLKCLMSGMCQGSLQGSREPFSANVRPGVLVTWTCVVKWVPLLPTSLAHLLWATFQGNARLKKRKSSLIDPLSWTHNWWKAMVSAAWGMILTSIRKEENYPLHWCVLAKSFWRHELRGLRKQILHLYNGYNNDQ